MRARAVFPSCLSTPDVNGLAPFPSTSGLKAARSGDVPGPPPCPSGQDRRPAVPILGDFHMNAQPPFDIVRFALNGLAKLTATLLPATNCEAADPPLELASTAEHAANLAAGHAEKLAEIERLTAQDIELDLYLLYMAWKRRTAEALEDYDFDVSFEDYKAILDG